MKKESRNQFLVWAIVLLAIMNLATFATILYHTNQSKAATPMYAVDQNQHNAVAEKFSGRYFCDNLNLTSEQRNSFRNINPAFRYQANKIYIQLAKQRQEMLLEMASADCDTNKLNVFSDSIGHLHSDLKKLSYKYYIDIKNICTPEQQVKLEHLFRPLFIDDMQKGYTGGKGHGRMNERNRHNRRFER